MGFRYKLDDINILYISHITYLRARVDELFINKIISHKRDIQ